MPFLEADLNKILPLLNSLNKDSKPLWGSMSAQRMIEHLSDTIDLALGKTTVKLEIPEDRVDKAQAFLFSEHPMPKNFKVSFATEEMKLRNDHISSAIQEFERKWKQFESFIDQNPGFSNLHPNFGELNKDQWIRLHRKHLTHHMEQFGLVK